MEKLFKLSQNKTTVKTEIIAGLTTFMTMAYIIALNPNLLTNFGAEGAELWNAVFMATCIASAVGMFVMAFAANKPFAMAPGMGLNSFFAVVVANIAALTGMTYVESFKSALCIILIEGIVFLILSILNVREKIVEAIPLGVRLGIAPAIGLMLMNIGLGSNVGIYSENGGPFYVMRDFFGALTPSIAKNQMGSGYATMVLTVVTMFVGLFVIIILAHKGIKAAVILGMLVASIVYWAGEAIFLDVNPFASLAGASFIPPVKDMVNVTLFKFSFSGFAQIGWFTMITLIITFCIIDMFDTIGTLVGTASRAGMVDDEGKMPQMKQALISDAVGTITGSITGTSTASTPCGTSAMVVISPICPPDSVPSAITASTPVRTRRFASATDATTGITLVPTSFNAGIYSAGLPAPVVTTASFSSTTTCITSFTKGDISIMFTPKGLSVHAFAL